MSEAVRGRYAPSPTGFLHLGNARTALVSYLAAKAQGGRWLLRIEDLDQPRTVPAALSGNLEELRWLGLHWDEGPQVGGPHAPYYQSQRLESYAQALETLAPHLFACYLSRKDVQQLASAPHGSSRHVYGAAERAHNQRLQASKRASGRQPALRFRVEPQQVVVDDAIAGQQSIAVHQVMGDSVLRRADGLVAYHLAVVVDDIAMHINQVVRGDDLLESSALHILLYRALGAAPPRYAHVPLLLDHDGQRMAKRKGSLTLHALRQAGVPATRVLGWLAWTLGLRPDPIPTEVDALLEGFSLTSICRSPYQWAEQDAAYLGIKDMTR